MNSEVDLYEKKYPKNWVVMQNKILQAFYKMTIDEKRLLLLASPIARLIDATQDDAIEIQAEDFANECGIKVNSAYGQMHDASLTLMNRQFSYKNEKGKRVHVQWVIRSIYDEACVSLCFTKEVLLMLKVFDKNNPFTKYKKEHVLALKGEYSIDMYHLAKKHQAMGKFYMSLDDYRSELGLIDSYARINNLKARTLHPALDEISEKTDIKLSYENRKKSGRVIGFDFTVKAKPQPKPKPKLKINNGKKEKTVADLNDKQIEALVCTEAFKADYNHMISPTSPINTDFRLWKPEMSKRLKSNPELFSKRSLQFYLDQIGDYKNK
ncbi:replication initiation protein [Psychrobacter faecalis]